MIFKCFFSIMVLVLFISFNIVVLTANVNGEDQNVICKSEDIINQEISACKEKNGTYDISYDSYKCKIINCKILATPVPVTPSCPSEDAKTEIIKKCESANMSYKLYKDNYGCEQINCVQTTTCPDVSSSIAKCKESGLDYKVGYDDKQCQIISCIEKPICQTSDTINAKINDCVKMV